MMMIRTWLLWMLVLCLEESVTVAFVSQPMYQNNFVQPRQPSQQPLKKNPYQPPCSSSYGCSALSMANGNTRAKIRSFFSRNTNNNKKEIVPSPVMVVTAKEVPSGSFESNNIEIPSNNSLEQVVTVTTTTVTTTAVMESNENTSQINGNDKTLKTTSLLVTSTQGRNPSQMLLLGKWQVLPRRSPQYTLQDAFATMGINMEIIKDTN